MGEIADMMLDGTLCEACGDYIGEPTGFPGYCSRKCAEDRGAASPDDRPRGRQRRRKGKAAASPRGEA